MICVRVQHNEYDDMELKVFGFVRHPFVEVLNSLLRFSEITMKIISGTQMALISLGLVNLYWFGTQDSHLYFAPYSENILI